MKCRLKCDFQMLFIVYISVLINLLEEMKYKYISDETIYKMSFHVDVFSRVFVGCGVNEEEK